MNLNVCMMTSSPGRVSRMLGINGETHFKPETRQLSPESEHMGDLFTKLKSGGTEAQLSSPKKDGMQLTPNGKMNPSYSPNGSQYAYEKAKMKALSAKKNLTSTENSDGLSPSPRGGRKRKLTDDGISESRPKRPRVSKMELKSLNHVDGASRSQVLDARDIIVAKRAGRVGNENQQIMNENESDDVVMINDDLLPGITYSDNSTNDSNNLKATPDKTSRKVLDQNLNHISECIKRDNSGDVYAKNLKTICDSSPLKGKMSAFEISLLKGKQNLERRKSIESAALRSSPRMNRNEQRPNYREKKKIKSRHSLESGFKRAPRKNSLSLEEKCTKKVDSSEDLSPSLTENEIIRPVPKRRRSRLKEEKPGLRRSNSVSGVEKDTPQFRLNGSPKLKNLPSRLSLDTLSGTTDTSQGSAFTSLNKIVGTRQISGVPPPLYSPSTLIDSSSCTKSSQRPTTLTVYKSDSLTRKSDSKVERCYAKATETARNRKPESQDHSCSNIASDSDRGKNDRTDTNTNTTKAKNRKSLEETVNMLRKSNINAKFKDYDNRMSVSPSRLSRRSSRSSTPNISPMKTEMLTPSSSPCSSTCQSLCASPTSGSAKLKKFSKKNYLFGRNDEVLARWQDGLYYVGKILRINDKQEKCLLRYEDDSEYWTLFKDIHRVLKEEEMVCCVCFSEKSEPPNEIVLCEYCLQGYHQQCHSPAIGSGKIIDEDEPWYCRKCVSFIRASGVGKEDEVDWEDELLKMKVTLPYDLDLLTWDAQHKNNTQQSYCYCGGPGIWFQKMLQCCRCKQWFHEVCIQCIKFPLLYADSFYIFVCGLCNTGNEYIKRLDVDWSDLVHIGLFNLALTYKKKWFDLKDELMPWVDSHWEQLQVTKYNDLDKEERVSEISKALDLNKTRFVSGSEFNKSCSLWGLRVRVPPPRIHITLPFSDEVTDQQMNKLKIKGKRSKVFTPVECKSPVNQVVQGPSNLSTLVKKRLDGTVLNQAERKLSPSKQLSTSSKVAKKPKKPLPLLDKLITVDEFYSAHNHPFRTEVEQIADSEELKSRATIWNKFLSLYEGRDENDSSIWDENSQDEPPILEKVEPIVPINSSNGTPPMPEIKDKKNRKKSLTANGVASDKKQNDRARRRKSSQRPTVAIENESEDKDDSFTIKHIKSVTGGKYYCRYDKTGYGKGFQVVGKRCGSENDAEYLVQWDT